MPIPIVNLDDRKFQELLDEASARIAVHNPEWTNFNKSDPGITLLELFAFLTESLLYRANQIPDRNRRKFLSLLDVPVQPASSARGIVTFSNVSGPLQTVTLSNDIEVRAGQVPFRTKQGVAVLPIESQVYFKRELPAPEDQLAADYYKQLYASFLNVAPTKRLRFYETVPLNATSGLDLANTVDNSVWIALLLRSIDKPVDKKRIDDVRRELANSTLSLGIVPFSTDATRHIRPGDAAARVNQRHLQFQLPIVPADGLLPNDPSLRDARYKSLPAVFPDQSVLDEPGVVEITLPDVGGLVTWENLEPTEGGVGDFPPALEDTNLSERVITWLRITPHHPDSSTPVTMGLGLSWVGINAAMVSQRTRVAEEVLPKGTGEPDQVVIMSRTPVLLDSIRLTVTGSFETRVWQVIDDLSAAGPEVPSADPRSVPGRTEDTSLNSPVEAFTADAESGIIRFGDGTRGARPMFGADIRASYDYSAGPKGNVGVGAINSSPVLPQGLKVTNPVRTWGGAEAETIADAEKQISRYVQHRDRLVNAIDFETVALRTPGVRVGRVDILPAYNPELAKNAPGDAPGAVTVMVVPGYDASHPDTPEPDTFFLDAVCNYLGSRRLVTTELFVRGPRYKPIVISVGLRVVAGFAAATVFEAVKKSLLNYLSPLGLPEDRMSGNEALWNNTDGFTKGWPRTKPVIALELHAVANRVRGVQLVVELQVALEGGGAVSQIELEGLELPRVVGISVVAGDPIPVTSLSVGESTATGGQFISVPIQPEVC